MKYQPVNRQHVSTADGALTPVQAVLFRQDWLILQNAADIGSGPVRRLPPGEINDIRQQAAISRAALMAYSNREKVSQPRRTRAHGA